MFSFTLYSQYSWRQMCGVPTYQAILYNTSWVSHNAIQLWTYLPGVSLRPHKLGAPSHKTASSSGANCKSQVVTCISHPLAINRDSHNPLLGFGNYFARVDHRIQGNTFTSLLWRIQMNSQMRRHRGKGVWEGAQSFHALFGSTTSPAPPCVYQPGSSLSPVLLGFLWRLYNIDTIHH